MRTNGQLLKDFCTQTGGTTPTEIAQAQTFITDAIQYTLSCYDWDRTEVVTMSLQPLQAFVEAYPLPFNFKKMNSVRLFSESGYPYTRILYYIDNNRSEILIYPTPPKDGDYLEFTYAAVTKELTLTDYTTGNIAQLTNGSTTVIGSGTSWTQSMIGAWMQVTDSWSSGGDGMWYQIAAVVSATELQLTRPYNGYTVAGSLPYVIGQVPVINPDFGEMVNFKALQMYMIKNRDFFAADRYEKEFETRLARMKSYERSKTTSGVVENVGIFTRRY